MSWSDELQELTRQTLQIDRGSRNGIVALKHEDGRFGSMTLHDIISDRFVVTDRRSSSLTEYADAKALINDGWAVD